MSSKFHVGTSPLTGRIYAGRLCRDEETWSGQPHDVTLPAMVAVAEHVHEAGHPVTVRENGVPIWEISVRSLRPESGANAEPISTLPHSAGFYWWRKSVDRPWFMVEIQDVNAGRPEKSSHLVVYEVESPDTRGAALRNWAHQYPDGEWVGVLPPNAPAERREDKP